MGKPLYRWVFFFADFVLEKRNIRNISLEEHFNYDDVVRQDKWILNLLQLEKVWTASPQACADQNPHTHSLWNVHISTPLSPKPTLNKPALTPLWGTCRLAAYGPHTDAYTHTHTRRLTQIQVHTQANPHTLI